MLPWIRGQKRRLIELAKLQHMFVVSLGYIKCDVHGLFEHGLILVRPPLSCSISKHPDGQRAQ